MQKNDLLCALTLKTSVNNLRNILIFNHEKSNRASSYIKITLIHFQIYKYSYYYKQKIIP